MNKFDNKFWQQFRLLALFKDMVNRSPFIYLGLPIGANPCNKKTWEPVVNKVRSRLSSWKSKTYRWGVE
jgi:hypothetical protein